MTKDAPSNGRSENSVSTSRASNEPLAAACLAASQAPEAALGIVLEHLRAAAGAERAFLVEAAPPPRNARVVAASPPSETPPAVSRRLAVRALAADRPLFWPDLAREPLFVDGASVRALALRSAVASPVPGNDPRRAALVLDHRAAMLVDGASARRLVRAFASLVGLLRRPFHVRSPSAVAEGPAVLNGRSPVFLRLMREIDAAAAVPLPVLVLGESGTGKELVARALHAEGPRATRRFVAINCAAIPETLLERELFGAARGAFTGADRDHPGLLRQADGGTVFLDEIGDMPLPLQAKLLRVLQERTVRAVGALDETPVDVRVVAATHRDLDRLVAAGRFRSDLRYRLEVLVVRVPALRERTSDLPLLADDLLARLAARCRIAPKRLSANAKARLAAHAWPGNVRELESVLARALLRAPSGVIDADDLDFAPATATPAEPPPDADGLVRAMIEGALAATRGNLTAAAARLGWSRPTLYRKMNALGLRGKDQAGPSGGGTRSSDSSTFQ
ncbi:MAG TPA: sigma 54-interacting transcriptional regulator [Candidatus Polarisedimenticolaceae bacterium]|nr:sigma 54-interacting transcriptional regulator [Candidatus Polarisedimenticolaceae bacterium]